MYRIDNSTVATSLPTPGAVGPHPNGFFTGGNPLTLMPATIVDADWANATQEEIAGAIEGVGIALSKTNRAQLIQTMKRLSGANANLTAITANVTLTPDSGQVYLDATTGGFTVTLPAVNAANNVPYPIFLYRLDSAPGNVVTVDAHAGDTFLPATLSAGTFSLPPQTLVLLLSTRGTEWMMIPLSAANGFSLTQEFDSGSTGLTNNAGFVVLQTVSFTFPPLSPSGMFQLYIDSIVSFSGNPGADPIDFGQIQAQVRDTTDAINLIYPAGELTVTGVTGAGFDIRHGGYAANNPGAGAAVRTQLFTPGQAYTLKQKAALANTGSDPIPSGSAIGTLILTARPA